MNQDVSTILLIDDTPALLNLVGTALRGAGYHVSVALTGEKGIERALSISPDLILLDIMMPSLDGYQTCRRLKAMKETKAIPIIFMSALTHTFDKVKGFNLGAVDYIIKPVSMAELLSRVRTHLTINRLQRELQEANAQLEEKVLARTEELSRTNDALMLEIKERQWAEEQIRYQAELVENVSDAIISTDLNFIIKSWNKAAENIYGWPADEVIGRAVGSVTQLSYPYDRREAVLAQFFSAGHWQGEITEQRRDGKTLNVLTSMTLLKNSAGDPIGAVAINRDITDHKRLEERFRQAQKMEAIGLLAGGIAHDFNNLLTAINGFAELVQRRLQRDDPLWEMMGHILGSGRRAASLVRQLLAFSSKQVIEPQVLNLGDVVTEMEKMLRRIIGEHIQMETILSPDLWLVKADPAQMEQVIINLAVNARDAMPEGGRLKIELANVTLDETFVTDHFEMKPGDHISLIISDSGYGMDDETQARIFEPFFTTKKRGKGTGLGLSTVFGIVKQSGGGVRVYSQEGRGTTFKIYLPRTIETAPRRSLPDDEKDLPLGSETILLVEDDAGVRTLIRRVLQAQGYRLLEAHHGRAALEMAHRHAEPIHLLLTDVVMPGLSGPELAEQLALWQPNLKILFISGYTDNTLTYAGELEPGVAFLQKPFNPPALAHKVRAVLDGCSH